MTLKRFYVLDKEGAPVNEPDFLKWATWFEASRAQCRVARDEFEGGYVSTVFLGIDHNWGGGGAPVLYETMIFGGAHDGDQWRYETRALALAGHQQALDRVRSDERTGGA